MPSSSKEPQGVIERARQAACDVPDLPSMDPDRFPDMVHEPPRAVVADAAMRVVLEHLRDEADLGGNMDDGLWCRRFDALLNELRP